VRTVRPAAFPKVVTPVPTTTALDIVTPSEKSRQKTDVNVSLVSVLR
jgi:hypothetical protein